MLTTSEQKQETGIMVKIDIAFLQFIVSLDYQI